MRLRLIIFLLTIALGDGISFATQKGDSVVVVYNTQMAGSQEVANHYAALRKVPASQVIGFSMSTNEETTRDDYAQHLESPLRKFLADHDLLTMEADASAGPGRQKVRDAKIRYVVLCYGVPLKIAGAGLKEPEAEKLPEGLRRNECAVDSELCLLPWPDPHYLRAGFVRNPYYGTTNAAELSPANGILIVARLDGPNANVSRSLVDKAMAAENDGLWGRAYFDLRGLPKSDAYRKGDLWLTDAARAAIYLGYDTVIDDKPETFSAGFPMSQIALYAGWYDPNVSGPFTQAKVEFMPGAFAYHLHSYSAYSLRTTTKYWCGPLLDKGATATMGCVQEPFLDGTPNIGIFFQRWLAGFTFGEAAYASQSALSWQTTVIGDPLYRPFGKVPREQHEKLLASHSPYLEWSYLRIANMDWIFSKSPDAAVHFLQNEPFTDQSAVLMEKLGNLFQSEGQTNVAIRAWERALKLNPSPEQAIRLTINIAARSESIGEDKTALKTYESFLKDNPNYPDALGLYERMEPLARRLHERSKALHYAGEIVRLKDGQKPPQ